MGFGQVFDNLTFKCMTALRKKSLIISLTTVFGYMES